MTDQPPESRQLAVRRTSAVVDSVDPLFDTDFFEQIQRASKALMNSTLIPKSVRGDAPEQCFSNIVLLAPFAQTWKMPLSALLQGVSLIGDKPMFEGKIIASAIEARLGFKLHHHYVGERGTDAYRVYVSDRSFEDLTDEQLEGLRPDKYPRGYRMIDGTVGDWKTYERQGGVKKLWTGAATRNQLAYRGDREWCRLFEPAVIVGVYGEDEMDELEARIERRGARQEQLTVQEEPARTISLGFADAKPAAGGQVQDAVVEEINPQTGEVTAKAEELDQDALENWRSSGFNDFVDGSGVRRVFDAADPVQRLQMEAYQHGWGEAEAEKAALENGGDVEQDAKPKPAAPKEEVDWQAQGRVAALTGSARATVRLKADRVRYDAGYEEGLVILRDRERMAAAGAPTEPSGATDTGAPDGGGTSAGADETQGAAQSDLPPATPTDERDEAGGSRTFDGYANLLYQLPTWEAVRTALSELMAGPEWKTSPGDDPRKGDARRRSWFRAMEVGEPNVLEDIQAFLCWMWSTEDPDAIQDKFSDICGAASFKDLPETVRTAFTRAVGVRMAMLR